MVLKLGLGSFCLLLSVSVLAQEFDVVAVPNVDDFLGPTSSMPVVSTSMTTPSASPDAVTDIFGQDAIKLNVNTPIQPTYTQTITPIKGLYSPKHAVLTKLPELPVPELTVEPYVDTTVTPIIQQPDYADKSLASMMFGQTTQFTIPKEVRLTFYAGQSSLSAQAIKWIKTFALKVRNDPRYMIEIRASETDWELQSKRVGLMVQILVEQGVSRHKIQVYKSPRSENSVLLGYASALDVQEATLNKTNKKKQKTIQW